MGNYKINNELNQALRRKYNPDGSELRKAQLRMLEMLKYLDKICRENGIEYWLEAGTLLGAVRHGGFIPWDDDVDVAMTRKDAKKLEKILYRKYREKDYGDFVLQCHENDPFLLTFWNKLRDLKSADVTPGYVQDHSKFRGLFIDIFNVDDNVNDWIKQKCVSLYHYLLLLPLWSDNSRWNKLRPLVPLFYRVMRHLVLPTARFLSIFQKNDYMNYSYGQPWNRHYPLDALFPLREIEFEGYNFMAPADLDRYLRAAFSDWEQIPSEDHIKTHNMQLELYF